jgi:hypothetical protein
MPEHGSLPVILNAELLASLEQRWRAAGALYLDEMAPGLTDEEINAIAAPLGFGLPEEARQWYRWHNGSSQHYVTPSRVMTPLAEDVERTLMLQEQAPSWQAGWLRAMDESPWVAFDCRPTSNDTVPVWHYDPVDHPTRAVFQSIGDMVTLWIEILDNGIWTWSVEKGWQSRDPLPAEITESLTGVPQD